MPRVIKVCGTCNSTVFEPRTTATATTIFARFLDDAAFYAYGTADRRSDGWCYIYVGIGLRHKEENAVTVNSHCLVCVISLYVHTINLKLTFASPDALKPPVTNVPVVNTSTILKPSTARSATTLSAGFRERATFGARRRFHDR